MHERDPRLAAGPVQVRHRARAAIVVPGAALSCRALCGSEWTRATSRPGAASPAIRARCSARSPPPTPRTNGSRSCPGAGRCARSRRVSGSCATRCPAGGRCSAPAASRAARAWTDLLGGASTSSGRPRPRRWRCRPACPSSSPSTTARSRSARATSPRYERLWHRLARPRALAAARRRRRVRHGRGARATSRAALGRGRDGRLPRAAARPHRARAGARGGQRRRAVPAVRRRPRAAQGAGRPRRRATPAPARAGSRPSSSSSATGRIADRRHGVRRVRRLGATTAQLAALYAGALARRGALLAGGLRPAAGRGGGAAGRRASSATCPCSPRRSATARCASRRATPRRWPTRSLRIAGDAALRVRLGARGPAGRRAATTGRASARGDARRPRRGGGAVSFTVVVVIHDSARRSRGAAGLDRAPPRPAARRSWSSTAARATTAPRSPARTGRETSCSTATPASARRTTPASSSPRTTSPCCSTPTASSSTARSARLAGRARPRDALLVPRLLEPDGARAAQRAPAARARAGRCCPPSGRRARCRARCASASSRGGRARRAASGWAVAACVAARTGLAAPARARSTRPRSSSTRTSSCACAPAPPASRPSCAPRCALVHDGGHATGPALGDGALDLQARRRREVVGARPGRAGARRSTTPRRR